MLGIRHFLGCAIDLYQGDLTTFVCDAMVNAANSRLVGGGGIDGAIHQAGGPAIMKELQNKYPEGCRVGSAVVTGAGDLPASYVIHTVGPIWQGGDAGEPEDLRSAYEGSFGAADRLQVRHLALPCISTGAYNYPINRAATIALHSAKSFITGAHSKTAVKRITFVVFQSSDYLIMQDALFKTFPDDE